LYGRAGKDGIKRYVVDKDLSNVNTTTTYNDNYNIIGKNSIYNQYQSPMGMSYYFRIPLHIDVNKSDRYSIRFETANTSYSNTFWAITNMATNAKLGDINADEMVNQNIEDGYGVGSMIVGSTNKVA
jgi:hypothetical protein